MIVSVALCMLVLGAMCWMLFTLAVYALPVWLAILSGLYLHGAGFGTVAALGGVVVGAALVIAGQIAFATIRSVPLRLAVGLIYAVPAGVAGFHASAGLARLTGATEGPALILACLEPRSSEVRPEFVWRRLPVTMSACLIFGSVALQLAEIRQSNWKPISALSCRSTAVMTAATPRASRPFVQDAATLQW